MINPRLPNDQPSTPGTTSWQPSETAPTDCSIIEIRYTHDAEPWGFSCHRSPDGVFRDLEGNPLYRTPDEWREEQYEHRWLAFRPGEHHG